MVWILDQISRLLDQLLAADSYSATKAIRTGISVNWARTNIREGIICYETNIDRHRPRPHLC